MCTALFASSHRSTGGENIFSSHAQCIAKKAFILPLCVAVAVMVSIMVSPVYGQVSNGASSTSSSSMQTNNFTLAANRTQWLSFLSAIEVGPILEYVENFTNLHELSNFASSPGDTAAAHLENITLLKLWAESSLQYASVSRATQRWSVNGSRGAVFLHETYVVAYLEAYTTTYNTESTSVRATSRAGGDRAAVIIYGACPYQLHNNNNNNNNSGAIPPICVQPSSMLAVRPYLLELVRIHLRMLMEQGAVLFKYGGV